MVARTLADSTCTRNLKNVCVCAFYVFFVCVGCDPFSHPNREQTNEGLSNFEQFTKMCRMCTLSRMPTRVDLYGNEVDSSCIVNKTTNGAIMQRSLVGNMVIIQIRV